jgi:hypothetical protein
MTPDPLTDGFLMLAMLSAAFIAMGVIGWFIDRLLTMRDARRFNARLQSQARRRDARMLVEQDRANDWIARRRADAVAARERAARRWC